MRYIVVGAIGLLALIAACGPTTHQPKDEWGEGPAKRPEITGNNAQDEARWRRELESNPLGEDAHLLTDDPPLDAKDYETLQDADDLPPKDFVGPPAPPSRWDNMQKGGTKFGKIFFSIMTVLVTLGMMAAPYLMMI